MDLVAPHRRVESELMEVFEIRAGFRRVYRRADGERFEQEFADFCDVPYCVGVGSGTDALRFALMAAGVGDGDIVVTVPNTFIATTEAISQADAGRCSWTSTSGLTTWIPSNFGSTWRPAVSTARAMASLWIAS